MRKRLDAVVTTLGWARLTAATIGCAVLAYGLVLAYRPHAATSVLAVGAVIVVVALVVPADWSALDFSWLGVTTRIERAKAEGAQEALAKLPTEAKLELSPGDVEIAEPAESEEDGGDRDVTTSDSGGASEQPTAVTQYDPHIAALARRIVEQARNGIAKTTRSGSGYELTLTRYMLPGEPTGPILCSARRPGGGHWFTAVPKLNFQPSLTSLIEGGVRRTNFHYTCQFPDDFAGAKREELAAGDYIVVWARSAAPTESLAQSKLTWPPPE